MLITFVVLYLIVSIGIGLYAGSRVHNTKDFAVAGRHLPLPVVTATVFATWFGAETVLGISATFVKDGLGGVVADPFGSSLCLIFAGLFFARKLYRMNLLTIGDYYRQRYNRPVEVVTTLCIVASYLGWVSAQIKALGLVFNVVTAGMISQPAGMVLGAGIVLTYTVLGGMLSVAVLDFIQMIVVMAGMLFIGWVISGLTGGVGAVIEHASAAGKLSFFPQGGYEVWIPFFGAWVTMMLGSIPQQDVFQRITSAKDENTAVRGSVLGGSIYFFFAFVPMFLAYAATMVDPKVFGALVETDSQLVLPTLILQHTPVFAQVIFFWCLAGRHHELFLGDAARALGVVLRKYRPRLCAQPERPHTVARNAHHHRGLCRHRAGVCAQQQIDDIPDGRERLQDHSGGGLRSPGLRALLEARHHAGRLLRHRRRPADLDPVRNTGAKRYLAGAAGGPARGHRRHAHRLAAAAARRPQSARTSRPRPPCRRLHRTRSGPGLASQQTALTPGHQDTRTPGHMDRRASPTMTTCELNLEVQHPGFRGR